MIAVPGTMVGPLYPQLHPICAEYLSGLHYLDSVNCHIALNRAPADVPATILQVPHTVHNGLSGIILDHNKAPGRAPRGKGPPRRRLLLQLQPQQRHRRRRAGRP